MTERPYPTVDTVSRLARMRRSPHTRTLVREHDLGRRHLMLPVFVSDADDVVVEIASMPGVKRWPVSRLSEIVSDAEHLGIPALLLFGIPDAKDAKGSTASAPAGVIQRAIPVIRDSGYGGTIVTDVCLCEYTAHGHCGLLTDRGDIDLGPSLHRLAETALSHARAGADIVAPSAMLDGQVAAIRDALDANGFDALPILSYSAKYASAFYGPFREAAGGAPNFGDRRSHQLDPANGRDALREHEADAVEGADMLMVKPGLAYLDVLRRSRDAFPDMPIAAYNVSGEYSMIKAAAERGWLDEREVVLESLLAFRRAGADLVITYHALDAARWLGAD